MRRGNEITESGRRLCLDILEQSAEITASDPLFGFVEDYSKIRLLHSLIASRHDLVAIQKGTSPNNRYWQFGVNGGVFDAVFRALPYPHRVEGSSPDLVLLRRGAAVDSALHLEMKAYCGMGAREQTSWPNVIQDLTAKLWCRNPSADAFLLCVTDRDLGRAGALFVDVCRGSGGDVRYASVGDDRHLAVRRVDIARGKMSLSVEPKTDRRGRPLEFDVSDLRRRYCLVFTRTSLRP